MFQFKNYKSIIFMHLYEKNNKFEKIMQSIYNKK